MEVTDRDIKRIPVRNLHVPLSEFVAVWRAVEQQVAVTKDWATAGVVETCRWLAVATVRSDTGPWYGALSPITGRSEFAYEELIQAECIEAEKMLFRRPADIWLTTRPGWVEATVETLNWAWRRSGRPPLGLGLSATG